MSQRDELFERKRRAMELMDAGLPWQDANAQSGLNYSRRGIQQLYQQWRQDGDAALIDHRHGHAYKATPEVRDWLGERCEAEPDVRASELTTDLEVQFGVELDPKYITQLRHELGVPVPPPGRPSQQPEAAPAPETAPEGDFPP